MQVRSATTSDGSQPCLAFMVGNRFIILKLGRRVLDKTREEVTLEELTSEMAGGRELAELSRELRSKNMHETVARISVARRTSTCHARRRCTIAVGAGRARRAVPNY